MEFKNGVYGGYGKISGYINMMMGIINIIML